MDPIELKTRRESLGMSQDDLASLLCVRRVAVSRWEVGMRKPRDIEEIRGLLDSLEKIFMGRVGENVALAESCGEKAIFTLYSSNDAFAEAHPDLFALGFNASMYRAVIGHARLVLCSKGLDIPIVEKDGNLNV